MTFKKHINFFTDYEHVGYKIAATSADGKKYINVSAPIVGILFKHNLFSNNDSVNLINCTMGVAESEFASKLSKNVYSNIKEIKEILKLIDYLVLTIELSDTRFKIF